jgi:structural maintenance of chromosome 4
VSIVAHYIKERTRDAQFIIISLRNNMFELADRLVGIYKTQDCTKSITINPGAFAVGKAVAAPVAAAGKQAAASPLPLAAQVEAA